MEFLAALPLGLLIGMTHALESDHLAAVASLQSRGGGVRAMVSRGVAWGLGHTVSLFAVCLGVFFLGLTISGRMEAGLEFVVGLMIAGLGAHVLLRMRRERIHLHAHEHADRTRHLHLHSHAGEPVRHADSAHEHSHKAPERAAVARRPRNGLVLAVGMMHGLAGSAGFLVLVSATADSLGQVLGYLLVFGLGSILGMAGLSAVVALPLGKLERLGGWLPGAAMTAIGLGAILVGGMLAQENFATLFGPLLDGHA